MATPPPIVSSKYFRGVAEEECLKRIPVAAVTSVKVTGDVAWGPAGGGVLGKAGALYDRPVRSGVAVGDGVCCWQNTDVGPRSSNNGNNRREIDGKRPARFNPG